jgi:vitamin B12 transporter
MMTLSLQNLFVIFLGMVWCVPISAFAQNCPSEQTCPDIPELFITANRVAVPVETVGRSIDVRHENEISAQNETNLPQALQDMPGIRSFEVGGPGAPGLANMEIRGFRTAGTALLLNGLTLRDPSAVSGTFENYLPHIATSDLDSIEVLKGGTSVLYGSDGQAGAVSLISKRPEPGLYASGTASTGSYDTYRESAILNAGDTVKGVLASVSNEDSSGIGPNGDYAGASAFVLGEYKAVPNKVSISPIFNLIDAKNDLQTGPSVDENGNLVPSQQTDRNNSNSQAYLVGATVDGVITDRSLTKTSVYTNHSDRDYFFDFGGFESRAQYSGSTFNVDFQHALSIPSYQSELMSGMQYEHQSVDTTSDGPTDSHQRDTIAAFLHDQWSIIPERLFLGAGGRVSHVSSIDKSFASLESSASYRLTETGSRLHTSISQGFRSPTLFESSGTIVDYNTGELIRVGNPNLDPEESLSTDFGIEQEIIQGMLKGDMTVFQIDSDETIVYDYQNNRHVNGGGGKTQGIESALILRPGENINLRAAYTNLDKAESLDGERRQRTPRNWFSISLLAEWEDWALASAVRYRDSQDLSIFGSAERFSEDSAIVFDTTLSYTAFKDFVIFIKGENIFDDRYTEAGYTMPRASVYSGVRFKVTAG